MSSGVVVESDQLASSGPHDRFDGCVHSEQVADVSNAWTQGASAQFQAPGRHLGGDTGGDLGEQFDLLTSQLDRGARTVQRVLTRTGLQRNHVFPTFPVLQSILTLYGTTYERGLFHSVLPHPCECGTTTRHLCGCQCHTFGSSGERAPGVPLPLVFAGLSGTKTGKLSGTRNALSRSLRSGPVGPHRRRVTRTCGHTVTLPRPVHRRSFSTTANSTDQSPLPARYVAEFLPSRPSKLPSATDTTPTVTRTSKNKPSTTLTCVNNFHQAGSG